MKTLVIVLLALLPTATLASIGVPANVADDQSSYAPSIATSKVTVQRVAQLRVLEWWEEDAFPRFRRVYPTASGSAERAHFLVQIDQSHVQKIYDKCGRLIGGKLNRKPADYDADYQTFTQLYNRTDWYVNVPRQELPPFQAGAPNAPLSGLNLSLDIESAPAPRAVSGAYRFGSEASASEVTVAAVGFVHREDQPRQKEPKPCPKPEPKPVPCPPAPKPVPPPPTPCPTPAPADSTNPQRIPTPPGPLSPQVNDGVGHNSWDPSPSHPHVADPVVHDGTGRPVR